MEEALGLKRVGGARITSVVAHLCTRDLGSGRPRRRAMYRVHVGPQQAHGAADPVRIDRNEPKQVPRGGGIEDYQLLAALRNNVDTCISPLGGRAEYSIAAKLMRRT